MDTRQNQRNTSSKKALGTSSEGRKAFAKAGSAGNPHPQSCIATNGNDQATPTSSKPSHHVRQQLQDANINSETKEVLSLLMTYFDNILANKNQEIVCLKSQVNELEKRVSKLEENLDSTNAYGKRDTLIISGNIPVVQHNEDCNEIARNLLKDQTRLQIRKEDILVAHRLGAKPKNQVPDKRNMMIKLNRHDLKADILNACKQFKPTFFVNESLTPSRNQAFYVLRQAKKRYPSRLLGCSTSDCSVYAYVQQINADQRSRRILCNTKIQLENLLHDELNTSLDQLGITWRE